MAAMREELEYFNYTLTLSQFQALSPGQDFLTPLIDYNFPTRIVLLIFQFLTPISVVLNLFVLVSCVTILISGRCDRPALLFIAYNSCLDLFTIVADAIVLTGAVNPSMAMVPFEQLPTQEELQKRCMIEKALVTYTMFASLGSVLLLTLDRFMFITQPFRYNSMMTLPRAGLLVLLTNLGAVAGALGYSFSVTLPWDDVCTFTHVLPLGLVIFWNGLFFVTWFAMHAMYIVILAIALKHKRQTARFRPTLPTTSSNSDSSLGPAPNTPLRQENRFRSLSRQYMSSMSLLVDNSQVKTTLKTVRYIVILLFIYSLVELPCVTVAIDDLLSHVSNAFKTNLMVGFQECKRSHNESMHVGLDRSWASTRISLLHCFQRFMAGREDCQLVIPMPLEQAPICQMLAETSHALHLTKVFTMSLLGWIANTLADPIVYAFWYPVFRRNLGKIVLRAKESIISQKGSLSSNTTNKNLNGTSNRIFSIS